MTFNCMDSLRCQPGWFRCHTSGQVLRCHSLESVNSLLNYTHEHLLLDYFVVKSSLLYLCAPQPIFRISMDISKSHKHPNNPKSPERKQCMVTPWGHPWGLKTPLKTQDHVVKLQQHFSYDSPSNSNNTWTKAKAKSFANYWVWRELALSLFRYKDWWEPCGSYILKDYLCL